MPKIRAYDYTPGILMLLLTFPLIYPSAFFKQTIFKRSTKFGIIVSNTMFKPVSYARELTYETDFSMA